MHKLSGSAALAAAVAAFAAPGAHAQGPSPDATDWHGRTPHQNLTSPDAQDAAKGRGTFSAPEVTVLRVSRPARTSGGGVDWADVGIGAGGMLGVVLLAGGGAAIAARRRETALASTERTAPRWPAASR
jgi:hypothetical protein